MSVKWSWISHVWNVVSSVGGIFYRMLCMLHDTRRKPEHSVTLQQRFLPLCTRVLSPRWGIWSPERTLVWGIWTPFWLGKGGIWTIIFKKVKCPGGCAGGCPGDDVEASIWPIHYLQKSAYGLMPLQPAETRPRSNFPESRVAFPRYNELS